MGGRLFFIEEKDIKSFVAETLIVKASAGISYIKKQERKGFEKSTHVALSKILFPPIKCEIVIETGPPIETLSAFKAFLPRGSSSFKSCYRVRSQFFSQ